VTIFLQVPDLTVGQQGWVYFDFIDGWKDSKGVF